MSSKSDNRISLIEENDSHAKKNKNKKAKNGTQASFLHGINKNNEFGMKNLIAIIDRLQKVFNTAGKTRIDLPQIIVVGEQSSGKSSVLESISGFPCFPRGTNTVTRCPIKLQLVKKGRDDKEYRDLSDKLGATDWIEFPQLSENAIETDFSRVNQIITNEVNRRAGGANVIVKEELILRIISPNVIDLTLVDLPGLVSVATNDQPEDIDMQITDMVMRYVANPNSIILAVSAANTDIANSKIMNFVKTIDPKGDRTISVLTKLDLMDLGTDAVAVLTGQILKVKLGIVGVVNRSYNDTVQGVSIGESIENEARFLFDNYPTIASSNGIPNLKDRLERLLREHILNTLPMLQTQLTNMQIQARNQIAELGNVNITNKCAVMLEIIEKFCDGFKSSIVGRNRHIQKNVLVGSAQINVALEEDLARNLKKITPQDDLGDIEILTVISNSRGIEGSVLIIEAAYQDLVRDQIKRLEEAALKCASTVNCEVINISKMWNNFLEKKMQRFPYLSAAISAEVTELLNERYFEVQGRLKRYVEVQASYIKTIQMDFNTEMQDLIKKNTLSKNELLLTTSENVEGPLQFVIGDKPTEIQKSHCQIVRQLVQKYFDIVKAAFQDYCPKEIAYTVVYYMEKHIQRRLTEKLLLHSPDKIDQLVRESETTEEKRKCANEQIQAVDRALEAIRFIKDIGL